MKKKSGTEQLLEVIARKFTAEEIKKGFEDLEELEKLTHPPEKDIK